MKTLFSPTFSALAAGLVLVSTATSAVALSPAESTSILFMKQEEKLARDVYQTLADRWGLAVFKNIVRAEERHMAALTSLVTRFELVDATPTGPGVFTVPELQKLHDELVARGQTSVEEALQVGVVIEQTDIADLKEAIATSSDPVLLRVYGNLLRGSTHHLSAFQTGIATGDPAALCATPGSCGKTAKCPGGAGEGACGRGERNAATGPCASGAKGQVPGKAAAGNGSCAAEPCASTPTVPRGRR